MEGQSFTHSSPPSQPPFSHSQSSSQIAGLSSSQRSAIQQLIAFTQCSERTAAKVPLLLPARKTGVGVGG